MNRLLLLSYLVSFVLVIIANQNNAEQEVGSAGNSLDRNYYEEDSLETENELKRMIQMVGPMLAIFNPRKIHLFSSGTGEARRNNRFNQRINRQEEYQSGSSYGEYSSGSGGYGYGGCCQNNGLNDIFPIFALSALSLLLLYLIALATSTTTTGRRRKRSENDYATYSSDEIGNHSFPRSRLQLA